MEGEGDNCVFFKDSFSIRDLVGDKGAVFELLDDETEIKDKNQERSFATGEECLRTVQTNNIDFGNEEEDDLEVDEHLRGHPGLFTFETIAEKMTNVTTDGAVKKLIMRRGIGSVVPSEALVDFHYQAYCEGTDEPFDSTYLRGRSERFSLGAGQILPGIEAALATMKKNELSRYLVQPALAYGKMGVPPRIPGNSEVLFEIELLNFVDGVEAEALNAIEKEASQCFEKVFKAAQMKYFEGNEFNKTQNYKAAISKYQKVRNMLEFTRLANKEEEDKLQKFLLKIYTNLAICYNKTQSPRKACSMCQLAERIDPQYCKALFAHGRALLMLHDYAQAQIWLRKALKVSPNNPEINAELLKACAKEREAADLERTSCARMFNLTVTPKDNSSQVDQDMAEFKTEAMEIIQNFYDGEDLTVTFAIGMTKREQSFIKAEASKLGLISLKNEDCSMTLKKP